LKECQNCPSPGGGRKGAGKKRTVKGEKHAKKKKKKNLSKSIRQVATVFFSRGERKVGGRDSQKTSMETLKE